MKYTQVGEVAAWTFYSITETLTPDEPLFGFTVGYETDSYGRPKTGELYNSLEHAMVAAVGEKYTGKRGAGGTAVGTAADWFMKMIGADQLQAVPDSSGPMASALKEAKGLTTAPNVLARNVIMMLERTGHVLARRAGR
jgi:hypothetical protein